MMDLDSEEPSTGEEPNAGGGETSDNPYHRLALTIICLVAAGLILVGGLDVAAYWFKCRHDKMPARVGRMLSLSIPFVIGWVVLIASPALARRVETLLED